MKNESIDEYRGKLGGGTGGAEETKFEDDCIATFSSEDEDYPSV